jgi:hypothetical protein
MWASLPGGMPTPCRAVCMRECGEATKVGVVGLDSTLSISTHH